MGIAEINLGRIWVSKPAMPTLQNAYAPDFRFPIPDSRFPIPDSRFPIPWLP
ncbi:hypothetical protein [Moorena producens]|uniref:hypothetical protein n=1 Tax=Moorena producens TaxID=1155739 RepID=UPI00131437CF|nr:hypothetical protein [Moorena producens]